MTTLEAAFAARIRAIVATDDDPARVLVYPDWHGRQSADIAAEMARHRERWPRGRYTNARPDRWPAGLPLPLTVSDARAAVLDELDELAGTLAEEVRRIGAACAPGLDESALLSVVGAWPLDLSDSAGGASLGELSGADMDGWGPAIPGGRRGDGWPVDVDGRDVALWARAALDAEGPPLGSELLDVVDALRRGWPLPVAPFGREIYTIVRDGLRWPAVGLALVFRAERERSPLHAARVALSRVRALLDAAAAGDRGALAGAVRAELEALDPGDVARTALGDDGALSLCVSDLAREASRLRPIVAGLAPTSDAAGLEAADTMARALADVLDELGPDGRERAARVRERAAARAARARAPLPGVPVDPAALWAPWAPDEPAPRWILSLAAALIPGWRPRLALATSKHAPALPLLVRRELDGLRHGRELRPSTLGGFELVTLDGRPVGRFVAPSVDAPALERLRAGASRLHGLTFERVVRGLTRRTYQQAVEGVNPYTRLVYPGGFERFAADHAVSDYERKGLPAMFEALQNYRRDARDVPPILTYWLRKASPAGRAELRIDVGEALVPGYVSTLPAGPGRWLLPVLEVPFLDFADRARHGALCALQWAILGELRERVEDYAAYGALDVDVSALASKIDGLTGPDGDRARRAWIDGPAPWLRADARGRVALLDDGADRLLKEAAAYTENARRGGRALSAIRRGERVNKPRG